MITISFSVVRIFEFYSLNNFQVYNPVLLTRITFWTLDCPH